MKVFMHVNMWILGIVDLSTQLAQFVERETEEWNDINASKSLDRVINKEVEIEDLVNKWNQVFTQVCSYMYDRS